MRRADRIGTALNWLLNGTITVSRFLVDTLLSDFVKVALGPGGSWGSWVVVTYLVVPKILIDRLTQDQGSSPRRVLARADSPTLGSPPAWDDRAVGQTDDDPASKPDGRPV